MSDIFNNCKGHKRGLDHLQQLGHGICRWITKHQVHKLQGNIKHQVNSKLLQYRISVPWTPLSLSRPAKWPWKSGLSRVTLSLGFIIYMQIWRKRLQRWCPYNSWVSMSQSLIRVVFHQGGFSSEWSFVKVVFHQGGLSSGWSFIECVSRQGGFSSGWFLIRVAFHQGGLLSVWSFIMVVSHQGSFSSGWSFTKVVFHQGGLSPG